MAGRFRFSDLTQVKDRPERTRNGEGQGIEIMTESNRDYYRRRFAEETERAANGACEDIRGVHRELAELYSERLAALESNAAATTNGLEKAA